MGKADEKPGTCTKAECPDCKGRGCGDCDGEGWLWDVEPIYEMALKEPTPREAAGKLLAAWRTALGCNGPGVITRLAQARHVEGLIEEFVAREKGRLLAPLLELRQKAEFLADAVIAGLAVDRDAGNFCKCGPAEECWDCRMQGLADAVHEKTGGPIAPGKDGT